MKLLGQTLLVFVVIVGVFYLCAPRRKPPVNSPDRYVLETGGEFDVAATSKKPSVLNAQIPLTASHADIALESVTPPRLNSDTHPPPQPPEPQLSERRVGPPDYTAENFKTKFRHEKMESWLKESRPIDSLPPDATVPNDMEAYLLKGEHGEAIRYRQSMGFAGGNDCVSILMPDGQPIVGFLADQTLEIRATNVKWAYIIILKKRYFFVYHIDTTNFDKPVTTPHAMYFYERANNGTFSYRGELVGDDPHYGDAPYGNHESLDFCTHTY